MRPGANSSGCLKFQITLCHPDEIGQYRKSSGWYSAMSISYPDEIQPIAKSSGWLMYQINSHLEDIGQYLRSSGWHTAVSLSLPDAIRPGANSFGWFKIQIILCHPGDLRYCPYDMPPGWLNWRWYLILIIYAPTLQSSGWQTPQGMWWAGISSGWVTANSLSQFMSSGWDSKFRFSQHAVAFQRFRMKYL